MSDNPDNGGEPTNLMFLRILVIILTGSMIAGLVTIIILIVIRVPNVIQTVEDPVPLPGSITLPDGTNAESFTQSADWYAVITTENEILIFNRDDGTLRQKMKIQHR